MTDDESTNHDEAMINRRTIIRSAAAASTAGLIGVPAFSGSALTADTELKACGPLDIMCAIDTSGSLSRSEISKLENGVNSFISEFPTGGRVTIGTLEFGNSGVRNKNDLQGPSGLNVSLPSRGSGNTPMPGTIDIADQAVHKDSAARSGAVKLVVLFTDGGPNYTNTSYTEDYTAPRDDSANWSAVSGDSTYDNADAASATVSKGEMNETALVARSIKDRSVGDGATLIATVYAGNGDTEAMTSDAVSTYATLPRYLKTHIASSGDLAINVSISNVEASVKALVDVLADLDCERNPEGRNSKPEWVEDPGALRRMNPRNRRNSKSGWVENSKSGWVEDGEGDLSAYTGNTSYYGTTSNAISGSRSIIAIGAEHNGYRTIASTAGLSNYPEAGDTFRFDVAVDTRNTYGGALWGVQSESSPWPCYRLRLDTGATPGVEFEKITTDLESHNNPEDNKLAPWLHDNEDVRPDVGTVYTVTVEWRTDGLMPFTIEEKATGAVLVEETDPNADTEYTSGGVGFMSSRSWDGQDQAEARFDNYELL